MPGAALLLAAPAFAQSKPVAAEADALPLDQGWTLQHREMPDDMAIEPAFALIGANTSEIVRGDSRYRVTLKAKGFWVAADVLRQRKRLNGTGGVSYALALRHSIDGNFWLGFDISGKRRRGGGPLSRTSSSYMGPSLNYVPASMGGDVRFGLGWAQKTSGNGPGSGPRLRFDLRFR